MLDLPFTQTVFISKSLTLQGGYQPTDWLQSPPDHVAQPTILDPQGQGRAIYVTAGVSVTLDRLILQNGVGSNIYNEGADLTLKAMQLLNGQAKYGGAIYHAAGQLMLNNSLLIDNQAMSNGGAIYINGGEATLQNNTFYRNQAAQLAGAVYLANDNLAMTNNILANQVSGSSGGAVRAETGQPSLSHNLYYQNVGGDTGGTVPIPVLADNVFADPQFGNPGSQTPDLSLRAVSPARDMGQATSWPLDYGNHDRWAGAAVDIGAFEFEVAPGVTLTANQTIYTSAGQTVVISHTLTNNGQLADTFVLSYTSSRGWTNLDLNNVTLAPDETAIIPLTVTVPLSADGLSEVTTLIATSELTATVSAAVVDTVFVTFEPALILASNTISRTKPLSPITYTHRLTNSGTGFDTYQLSASSPTGWQVEIVPASVSLEVGSGITIAVKVTPPGSAQAISGTVGTTVITASSQYSPTVTATVTESTIIERVFSLTLTAPERRAAWPGENVTYIHNLVNQGNFTETVILATDSAQAWAVSLHPMQTVLAPGQMESIAALVTVPANGAVSDTMHITATLLSQPAISASVSNITNRLERGVVIAPPWQSNGLPGETITFSHRLTNTGNLVISETFAMTVGQASCLSVNGQDKQDACPTITPPQVTLPSGGAALVTVSLKIPFETLSGTVIALPVTAVNLNDPAINATVIDALTVGLKRGVRLQADQTARGQFKQAVVYTHTLTNQSNVADTFALSLQNDLAWPIQLDPPGPLTLAAHESALLTVTVTISGGSLTNTTTLRAVSVQDSNSFAIVKDMTMRDLPAPPRLVSPLDNYYTRTNQVAFQWTASPIAVSYLFNLDDAFFMENGTVKNISLTEGVHTWTMAVQDEFGQQGNFTDSWRVIIDQTAPTMPMPLMPTNGGLSSADTTFRWTAATDMLASQLSYIVVITPPTGQAIITTVANITLALVTVPQSGLYQWTVQAVDEAENSSPVSAPFTFTVDAVAPSVPVPVVPLNGNILPKVARLDWLTSTDQLSGVASYRIVIAGQTQNYTLTVDGASSSAWFDVPSSGIYSWVVQAIDGVGNASAFSLPQSFTVDLTQDSRPVLVSPLPESYTRTTDLLFRWQSTRAAVSYTLKINSRVFTDAQNFRDLEQLYTVVAPTTTLTLAGLPNGHYTWTVQAIDGLGQTAGYTDSWRVTMDNTPPLSVTLLTPLNGSVTSTNRPRFAWTDGIELLSPPVSYTLEVWSSPQAYRFVTTASAKIADLPDGVYTWTVRASDQLGNLAVSAQTFKLTIKSQQIVYLPVICKAKK